MASGIKVSFRRALASALVLSFLTLPVPGPAQAAAASPELPRLSVDTTMPAVTGQTINVAAGGNLQTAIDNAQPGDEIVLQAGASYAPVTLPVKSGNAWIVIRSSRANELPAGTRVTPADAPKMAKIVGGAGANAAVQTANGAHHYRFVGIEFTVSPGAVSTGLVRFGSGYENSASQMPHHLIVDRCYVHGDPSAGGRRGVNLNSGEAAVIDSYISGWREPGTDSQAIAGWNGPGPYKIENNYLEGASENVMFGGADPLVSGMQPSDITIRRNHLFKPTSWRNGGWQVKNLFELKNAVRVLVDGNLFENNWAEAQNGTAILFSVRNQDGTAPWTAVNDVTFTNNIVRHVAAGLKITGRDDTGYTSVQTNRVLVRNNVFDDINSGTWGGDGRMFFLLYGATNVTLDHNTGFPNGAFIYADNSQMFTNHVITNNITTRGNVGFKADGNGEGLGTLNGLFPSYVFSRNALIGASSSSYPADNFFPGSTSAVPFVDFSGGNYRLASTSAYKGQGTDGKDVGADLDAIEAAMAGTGSGTPPPPPPPPPPSAVNVTFSNPAASATVSGTTTVTVAATGGSGTGYTHTVKVDTATIYSGGNGTFSWNTTTATNGSQTLDATVTDSNGGSGTASRTVTVNNTTGGGETPPGGGSDTTAPTVSITSPTGNVWTGNSIYVAATASDNVKVTKIELWGNGQAFATVTCTGTTCSTGNVGWVTGPLPNAAYQVNAVAYDAAGNKTVSAARTIYKNATSPVVASGAGSGSTPPPPPPPPPATLAASFTSPSSGATVSGTANVGMSVANATGSTTFTLELGTTTLSSQTVSGSSATYAWNTTGVTNGSQTLSLTATNNGATATASLSVTVSNVIAPPPPADATAPTVSLTAPSTGVWIGNSIYVAATASDNVKLAKIELWGNGQAFATVTCSSTTCSTGTVGWVTGSFPNAAYQVQAVAYDTAGNKTVSAPRTVYKNATSPTVASGAGSSSGGSTPPPPPPPAGDTTLPTVQITSPTNNAWTGNAIDIVAAGSDNVGLTSIKVYGNGTLLQTVACNGTATCNTGTVWWATGSLPSGQHTITVVATDTAGNTKTSSPVTINK